MIITIIIGILLISILLIIFSTIQISKQANEMEEKYERENKRHSNKSN